MVTGAGGMLADAVGAHLAMSGDETFGLFYSQEEFGAFRRHFPQAELVRLGEHREDRQWVDRLRAAVSVFRPDWIFHFAAWTDVDGCELNENRAYRSNAVACFEAALVAREVGARLLSISTDYVFNGELWRPYREDDAPKPLSVYGRTKYIGERMIQRVSAQHVIVRTAWLHGPFGRNFVRTIAQKLLNGEPVKVVDDQRGCPTYTLDLAAALRTLAIRDARGLFHVTNSGDASWYEFALAIGELFGREHLVGRITTSELGRPAARPKYSVLDNSKFIGLAGRSLPHWRDSLVANLRASVVADEQGGLQWVGAV